MYILLVYKIYEYKYELWNYILYTSYTFSCNSHDIRNNFVIYSIEFLKRLNQYYGYYKIKCFQDCSLLHRILTIKKIGFVYCKQFIYYIVTISNSTYVII